jgi:polyphenol oxidase
MSSSRGRFISGLTAGTGALLVRGAPAVAQPYNCFRPGPRTRATPWTKPDLKVLERKAAWSLSAADANVVKLRAAYKKMQALPQSDPHSMIAQRNMHAYYCDDCPNISTNQQIHGSYRFFPWHRAFLYFHERILGSLIGDFSLRLTYFDWEVAAHRAMPPIYTAPGQSLLHPRALPNGSPVYPASDFTIVPSMMTYVVDDFMGDAGAGGTPEGKPHDYGHTAMGDDMGVLNTAAFDPIFFCHHGNVDRMWASWQHYHPGVDPGGAYSTLRFSFWDENKKWVSIGVADVADTTNLGYTYASFIPTTARVVKREILLQLATPSRIGPPPPPEQLSDAAAVDIHLRDLAVPADEGFFLVQAVTPDGKSHDLGTFATIPHVAGGGMSMSSDLRKINLVLAVAPEVARQIATAGTTFRIQQRSARNARPSPNLLLGQGVPKVTPARIGALSLTVR